MLVVIACIAITTVAEKINITVKGVAPNNAGDVIVFVNGYGNNGKKLDVSGGTFNYTTSVERNSFLLFWDTAGQNSYAVVVDGTSANLNMRDNQVSGTPLNDSLNVILRELAKHDEAMKLYRANASKETDATKARELRAKARQERESYKQVLFKAVENNKRNCLPAYLIAYQGISDFSVLEAYANSGMEYTKHPMFANVMQYVQSEKPKYALVGKIFLDFSEKGRDGKLHKLSEYVGKGNYVLIDFWASWCGPCMGEMPTLKEAKRRFGKNGFEILGISLDNNETQWKAAIDNGGFNWLHLSCLNGWRSEGVSLYNIKGIPANFLCNGDGVIIAVDLRGEALLEKLEEIYETM